MALDQQQIINLSELLLSPEDLNTEVAFSILDNHEFPMELITEVFAIFKISSNKSHKAKAKKLLEKYGSGEVTGVMSSKYPLTRSKKSNMAPTEKTIMKNIIHYTRYSELDGIKLAKALYKKTGVGATYLLKETPEDQRRETLKTFINGASFQLNDKALTQFPPELFEFPELEVIDLGKNKITSIPKKIEVFKNLKVLRLGNNKLKSIHKNFLKLTHLEELDISQNDFRKNFPEIIFEMTQLKKLNIISVRGGGVYHENLPESFFNLKNLEELKLAHSLSRTYPNYPQINKVTGNPINLDPLEIAYAAFAQGDQFATSYILKFGNSEEIIKVLKQHYDSATKTMNFTRVYLEHIPKEIVQFDIKKLVLNNCYLGYVYGRHSPPKEERIKEDKIATAAIGELVDLEYLELVQTRLSGITDLSKLQKLKTLNLNSNSFLYFPKEFLSIKGLEELYLMDTFDYYGAITTKYIPTELNTLTNLKQLKLRLRGLKKDDIFWTETLPKLLPNCNISMY